MQPHFSRRDAIASGAALTLGITWIGHRAGASPPDAGTGLWPSFPHQNPDLVREIVGVCHRDLARATELVKSEPALANAAWDWGFGDWETALGAAAHTGRREIAEMLLEHGARLDIFAAASLGYTAVVKAMIEARPGIQRTWGPHGIPLAAHSRAGGDAAKDTLDYLLSLGDADAPPAAITLTDEQRAVYAGSYAFGAGPTERLDVKVNKQWLEVTRGDDSARRIHCVGDHTFFPAGVPSTQLVFAVKGERAESLAVTIGGRVVECVRA